MEPNRCNKMSARTPGLLLSDRFLTVPTTGSIRQSKKYEIVPIKDIVKGKKANAGFARCSSAANFAATDAISQQNRKRRDWKGKLGITRCSETSSKWVYNSLHCKEAKNGQYEEGKVDHVQTTVSTGPVRVACQGCRLMWGCVFSCRQKQHVRSLVEREYTGVSCELHSIRFSEKKYPVSKVQSREASSASACHCSRCECRRISSSDRALIQRQRSVMPSIG